MNPYSHISELGIFDGLWNMGLGVYDPNSVVWRNLANEKYAFDFSLNSNASWNDGVLMFKNRNNGFGASGQCRSYLYSTIEIGLKLADYVGGSGEAQFVFGNGDPSNSRMVSLYGIKGSNSIKVGFSSLDRTITTNSYNGIVSFAKAGDSYYLNGKKVSAINSATSWGSRGSIVCLGAGISNDSYAFCGGIAFIRMYGDVLTEDDMLNHAVADNSRFGLDGFEI